MPRRLFALILALAAGCGQAPPTPPAPASVPAGSAPASEAAASMGAAAPDPPASDAISHASPVYEAGPSVVSSGSVDGAALRKRNKKRLKEDTGPVSLVTGETPEELGRKICEAAVPKRPPGTPVLLKPNLGGFEWFKNPAKSGGDDGVRGRITDPEFVRGVIRCLRDRGFTDITVAEGWGATHDDWKRLIDVSGYAKMAREEGVPLVAMDDDGVFDVEGEKPGLPMNISGMEKSSVPTLMMAKILAETLDKGLFISLPKIKCHRFGVFSVAIKGMQGTIMYSDAAPAFRQKWRSHKELGKYLDAQKKGLPEDRAAYVKSLEKFAERMTDVLEIEAPDVVLAEGAPAVGGDGFRRFFPSAEKVAIGGTNPILVDRVAAEFLGLWDNEELGRELMGHKTSPLLTFAAERFGVDISSPEVVGDGAALLKKPRPVHFDAMAPFAIHSDASAPTNPGALGSAAPAGAPAPSGEKPEVVAPALGGDAIDLDGAGDEAAWARAKPARFETDYSGKATGIATEARFLWSPSGLYALFTLEGAGLSTDRSQPISAERVGLYKEDCVEIFLSPDPAAPSRYYEIELGPYGHYFDIDVDRAAKKSDTAWSSGAKIATAQDAAARKATIEVFIPAPEITKVLASGKRLPLGLYRMEGKSPRSYLAWSPPKTPKPNFHVPEAFGVLVLE
jgi:uncharacterized protein (DUF362 family)